MRIRKAPAGAFVVLCLLSAFAGLGRQQLPQYKQSDKVLHFVTFFLLTVSRVHAPTSWRRGTNCMPQLAFYWILETSRRRVLHLTAFVCCVVLAVGSEVLQGLLPNDRVFDPFDIVANEVGCLCALGLSTWYHKRMLERKRAAKNYNLVPGEDVDVELGEGLGQQESGVTHDGNAGMTVEEELDNWDENAEDWDAEDPEGANVNGNGHNAEESRPLEPKKRND
ncbi:uncharacterized protein K452DRAFT_143172 [Aplosporella prunicola CBS 121167]|uniref:VanZ-like domain-containing protein n=1 Tax=Aplosporella prunicola CBS 121167 TaxID=1176127 RepID=A0A6A6BPM4_9PEZI|nr:uncharacterized protein K452DRAFT_143172 [Aplosporella prunicola CBS 121167]KAF2144511.1 hypothetical protein K452DRAFT_143172 [Aplosporella prunicola CBS 121167]